MIHLSDPAQLPLASRQEMVREHDTGKSAVIFGLVSMTLLVIIGLSIDATRITTGRGELQKRLDFALTSAAEREGSDGIGAAERVFDAAASGSILRAPQRRFTREANALVGTASAAVPTTFSGIVGLPEIAVTASGRTLPRRP